MSGSSRFWLVLVAALVLVTVLVGGAGTDGPPLDPRSVNPDGARGIVDVLGDVGAAVELDRAVPDEQATSALMLQDRLSTADRTALEDWVRRGGVLVVADPFSSLSARIDGLAADEIDAGTCTIGALSDARSVTGGGRTFVGGDAGQCFGSASRPFLSAEALGSGTVVSVGGPGMFTNEELGRADNAFVAVALLAPDPGAARITVVAPSQVEFGDGSFTGRVPTNVRNGIVMLLASFLLYALFRMRRLGQVVREPLPVQIRGSELVLQAGVLSSRAGDPAGAAEVIRADAVDEWRSRLADPDLDATALVAILSETRGVDRSEAERALLAPVASDDALVETVTLLDQLKGTS